MSVQVTESEFAVCRICNEYMEQSNLLELFDVFTKIVARIKEVFGVELINGDGMPSSICRQCNSDFESAQELRRRCVESNEYFVLNSEKKIKCEAVIKQELPDEEDVKSDHNGGTRYEAVDQSQDGIAEISTSSVTYDKNVKSIRPRAKQKSSKQKKLKVNWKKKEQSNEPVVCNICGSEFKRRQTLVLHNLRRHSNSKPFGCKLCPSAFCTNSELTRHMRRHTGEKPYECQYCHRRFSDYTTHLKHERTHRNERPFSCAECGRSFACTFILKSHMLVHTGGPTFKCEVCNKSFNRQHNLVSHTKTICHQKNVLAKTNEDGTTK